MGFFFFILSFSLACVFFFQPVARYPDLRVTCQVFIKGNVKRRSGNRSFCRSIPKVKALNQRSVIFPKPLLSCWKRREDCTSEEEGQLCGEGSTWGWDGPELRSWLWHGSLGQPWARACPGFTAGDAPSLRCSLRRPGARGNLCAAVTAPSQGACAPGTPRCSPGGSFRDGLGLLPFFSWAELLRAGRAFLGTGACHRLGAEDRPVPLGSPHAVPEHRGLPEGSSVTQLAPFLAQSL